MIREKSDIPGSRAMDALSGRQLTSHYVFFIGVDVDMMRSIRVITAFELGAPGFGFKTTSSLVSRRHDSNERGLGYLWLGRGDDGL